MMLQLTSRRGTARLRRDPGSSTAGTAATRQGCLPFLERRTRLERAFKRAILALTALAAAGLVLATPVGRCNAQRFLLQTRSTAARWLGLPPDRWAIEADWCVRRRYDIAKMERVYREVYAEASPELSRLLDFGGLAPGDGFFRWGNYNVTFLFPSKVFEPDDHGRSYRLRPNTRAVWLRNVRLSREIWGFFLMPDVPELRRAVEGTGATILAGSQQTTNSWGCRGPEPDVNAPLRGLILGDSNMQGMLVGDDQTPPERLRHELEARLNTRVSLLNTGHLGYSPEQFYYSLREYGDRFKPHFVLFSFCFNDFGAVFKASPNARDVDEGRYWITKIFDYCKARGIHVIAAPVPHEDTITGTRQEEYFPGRICNLLPLNSLWYCNTLDAFADEHVRLMTERERRGDPSAFSPLFNGPLHDLHMSPAGTGLWGKTVGRRLALLLEREKLNGRLRF